MRITWGCNREMRMLTREGERKRRAVLARMQVRLPAKQNHLPFQLTRKRAIKKKETEENDSIWKEKGRGIGINQRVKMRSSILCFSLFLCKPLGSRSFSRVHFGKFGDGGRGHKNSVLQSFGPE